MVVLPLKIEKKNIEIESGRSLIRTAVRKWTNQFWRPSNFDMTVQFHPSEAIFDFQAITLNIWGHRHAYPFIIWAYDVTLRVRTCSWDKFWIFFVNLKIFAFTLFALGLSYLAEMLIAPFCKSLFLDSIAFV